MALGDIFQYERSRSCMMAGEATGQAKREVRPDHGKIALVKILT